MEKLNIVFMGTSDFAVKSFEALKKAGHQLLMVVTQPNRFIGRNKKSLFISPVAKKAMELGVKVLRPSSVGATLFEIEKVKPDVICVVAFGQKLPSEFFNIPYLGCINLHASLLPKLRGAAPINWTILSGSKVAGVSTIIMDEGLDTGKILLQKEIKIGFETAKTLSGILSKIGADLLVETLKKMVFGQLSGRIQDESKATYAQKLVKNSGRIDWDNSVDALDCFVRGMDPWPVAFTTWKKKLLRLFAPTARLESKQVLPGTFLTFDDIYGDFFWVSCQDGVLGVNQVQLAGKKRMSAKDFLRGSPLRSGDRLGNR